MATHNKKPTMDEYQEIQAIGLAEKVEIISTDDEKIKSVGELLSSDSSRNILKLLFDQVLTANQNSQKTEISLPLVIYHLKKMQDLGIVKMTNVGKNIKTQDMKFYTSSKFAIVILPSNVTEKAKTSKSLANSFKAIYRFGSIAVAAVATWFVSRIAQNVQTNPNANMPGTTGGPAITNTVQEAAKSTGPAASTAPTTTGSSVVTAPAPSGAEQSTQAMAPVTQGAANSTGPATSTAQTASSGSYATTTPAPSGVEHGAAPVMAPVIHGAANNTGLAASTAPTTLAGSSAVGTVPAPSGAEHGAVQVIAPVIQAQQSMGIAADILWSVIFTLSVVIAGLIIERVFRAYRR